MKEYYLKLKRLSDGLIIERRVLISINQAKQFYNGQVTNGVELLDYFEIR